MRKKAKKTIQHSNMGIAFTKHLGNRKRLLIVDDDDSIRDIFKIVFEKAGYELDVRENGNELFQTGYQLPDLYLIDKQLSGVDGLDICRFLKSNSETKNIPVLIVSASPDIGHLSQKAGADGYIEKPFDLNKLLGTVEKFLGVPETTYQRARQLK